MSRPIARKNSGRGQQYRVFALFGGHIAFVNKFAAADEAAVLLQRLRRRYAGLIEFWQTTDDHDSDATWRAMKAAVQPIPSRQRGHRQRPSKSSPDRKLRRALDREAVVGFAPGDGARLVKAAER